MFSKKNLFCPRHEAAKSVLLMALNVYKTIYKKMLDVEDDFQLSTKKLTQKILHVKGRQVHVSHLKKKSCILI